MKKNLKYIVSLFAKEIFYIIDKMYKIGYNYIIIGGEGLFSSINVEFIKRRHINGEKSDGRKSKNRRSF